MRERAAALAGEAGFQTEFVGYETTETETAIGAVAQDGGRLLVKLVESPFYATGGGQIADIGSLECAEGECLAEVRDVIRLGEDQVLELEPQHGLFQPGERVRAHVDPATRHATQCNHTATHLLHAALRRRLGPHVNQAGSYVGPDKLRFDFTHGGALSSEELSAVEDDVNRWILENHPVRAVTTTLTEARKLGATALFGEKYGDIVRVVTVGDGSFSRELCGGTHVRSTAEIGLFKLVGETSSSANVRRIEALTGPEGVRLMREHDRALARAAVTLRVSPEHAADAVDRLRTRVGELEQSSRRSERSNGSVDVDKIVAMAVQAGGAQVVTAAIEIADGDALSDLADRAKAKLGDAVIVLGRAGDGRVDIVASVSPSLVSRGLRAGEIVKLAAQAVGGGGGGRDTHARAGGRDPAKLPDAIRAAREAIEAALGG